MSKKEKATKSEKRLPRFGVLDAVIIILVIAAVCGIYFRYSIMDTLDAKRNIQEYVVEFSIDNINATTTRFIQENDEIRFASDNMRFGTLVKSSQGNSDTVLSVTPSSEMFIDNGQAFYVFYPEDTRVNATGVIYCEGAYSDNGIFLVNGSRAIASGEQIKVYTDEVTVTLSVKSITLAE